MNTKIEKLLSEQGGNYIFPFFWLHGEDEETLRKYMKVIYESNIRAVCVESRPHPDFCGPKWWNDMDIILDEARKRDMKVWILDDSHFPTGYANGAVKEAAIERRRQSICFKEFNVEAGTKVFKLDLKSNMNLKKKMMNYATDIYNKNYKKSCRFDDDKVFSISAARYDGSGKLSDLRELSFYVNDNKLVWSVPNGSWKVFLCFLSRNVGIHRSYINMMDKESCRILIDAVYEPHYSRYGKDFGTTIAGFFSDEPELGNGTMYKEGNLLGTEQDLPWSKELEEELEKSMGDLWENKMALLWANDFPESDVAKVRYNYMDKVTRLVEEDFSKQIGTWCSVHGVEYIGHLIEDNNQHARTGSSLGHFFRGLSGQHMSGIDDIGGQVYPQGEELEFKTMFGGKRDGEFYHYALGKLGTSLGAIDPIKQGRTMCEIFGNYGWSEGIRMEKYLVDHFMVRGVNRFVPHAFNPKSYPDRDCPPHFYANGNDPLYKHFGYLMKYINRICELISDGSGTEKVAILYHAEAEWTGKHMLMQKPARILMENQIDFNFIPIDVFEEKERYQTVIEDVFSVNKKQYKALIIPHMQYIPSVLSEAIEKLLESECKVIFIDSLPEGICDRESTLPEYLKKCETISLENLLEKLERMQLREIRVNPEARKLRVLHYFNEHHIYYFVNEDDKLFNGKITIPNMGKVYAFDAWNNVLLIQESREKDDFMELDIVLAPSESRIIIVDEIEDDMLKSPILAEGKKISLNTGWKRSLCRSIDYPNFKEEKEIQGFYSVADEKPKFSGLISYEKNVEFGEYSNVVLEITDAYEGVEVFVNGTSSGIQIIPPYRFDIAPLVKKGNNLLRIEVATTLERENARKSKLKIAKPTGITGEVNLYVK